MIRCCEDCARKLAEKYILVDEPGRTAGQCPLCWRQGQTALYETSPRRPRRIRRTGGGEREKAGWRAG